MANNNQLPQTPVQGGDIAMSSVLAIPANTAVLIDTTADYTVVVPTAAGGVAGSFGITIDAIAAGGQGRVRMYGTAQAVADGSITRGGDVQVSDTATKMGRVKAKGAAVAGLGIALNSAADGDPVLVALFHALNA